MVIRNDSWILLDGYGGCKKSDQPAWTAEVQTDQPSIKWCKISSIQSTDRQKTTLTFFGLLHTGWWFETFFIFPYIGKYWE